MAVKTGNLATISFGSFSGRFRQIGEASRSIDKIEVDALDVEDQKELVPSDLIDNGEVEGEFYWEGGATPDPGTTGTVTVAYANGGGYSGSGFFVGQILPSAKNGELLVGKGKFAFDGLTTKFAVTEAE